MTKLSGRALGNRIRAGDPQAIAAVKKVLTRNAGNASAASAELRVDRSTLRSWVRSAPELSEHYQGRKLGVTPRHRRGTLVTATAGELVVIVQSPGLEGNELATLLAHLRRRFAVHLADEAGIAVVSSSDLTAVRAAIDEGLRAGRHQQGHCWRVGARRARAIDDPKR